MFFGTAGAAKRTVREKKSYGPSAPQPGASKTHNRRKTDDKEEYLYIVHHCPKRRMMLKIYVWKWQQNPLASLLALGWNIVHPAQST
jgi:hypothetical protein